MTATWTFSILGATGTAILLAVLATYLTTPRITASMLLDELRATIASLWKALALILVILVLANIANYSGGSTSMGTALAATGRLFPLIAPVIGWIGVFLTGSVVNNNTLFAPLQVATAETIGFTPSTLVAANTAGGNAAKVISPQSIAIAAGAVGLSGRESEILRASILYSLGDAGLPVRVDLRPHPHGRLSRTVLSPRSPRSPRPRTVRRTPGRCTALRDGALRTGTHVIDSPRPHGGGPRQRAETGLQPPDRRT